MLLVDALVGWLVQLAGDKLVQLVRGSPDERALREALDHAIDSILEEVAFPSREPLSRGLEECFTSPVVLSTQLDRRSLENGLRNAVAAQMRPLTEGLNNNDLGQSFYQVVRLDHDWLVQRLSDAFLISLRQVVAKSSVAELVHRLDADDVAARLDVISSQIENAPAAAPTTVTNTLPRNIEIFTGRSEEFDRLVAAITTEKFPGGLVTIDGMAGVGKTAFAIHTAHTLAPLFPDGQLFLPLHAHTPGQHPVSPSEALTTLLRATGMAAEHIAVDIDAKSAQWRDRLSGKRMLLLLDDVVGDEQVRSLLPGEASALVIITSRRRIIALEDAFSLSLDTLPPAHASELFNRIAQRPGRMTHSGDVAEIARLCGYLPLAVGLFAGRLRHHPSWSINDLLNDLDIARNRLNAVRQEDVSVASTFDMSYRYLPEPQKRLFRLLGVHVSSWIDAYAAAALADISLETARNWLDALYMDHMIDEPTYGRYRLHDLVRAHAQVLALEDSAADRDAAIHRLLNYYLKAATVAAHRITRHEDKRDLPASYQDRSVREFETSNSALSWLELELSNLLGCIEQAASTQWSRYSVGIASAISEFLLTSGHRDQAVEINRIAADIALETGDRAGLAHSLNNLGSAQRLMSNYSDASQSFNQALGLFHEIGDQFGEATTLNNLGVMERFVSEYEASQSNHQRALELYCRLGYLPGQADTLGSLGVVQVVSGTYRAAANSLSAALELFRALRNKHGEANALHNLGLMQRFIGEYRTAIANHERALGLFGELSYRYGRAYVLAELTIVQRITGEYQASAASLSEAASLFHSLGDRLGEAGCFNDNGVLQRLSGDYEAAIVSHKRALEMFRSLDYRYGQAYALSNLGLATASTRDYQTALDSLGQAVELLHDLRDPYGLADAMNNLGVAQRLAGDYRVAMETHSRAMSSAASIGVPLERARALRGIAECYMALDEVARAATFLERALVIYDGLDIPDAQTVRATLASLSR